MKKMVLCFLFGILVLLLAFVDYFFVGTPPRAEKIAWGVNFSQKHAKNLGLDWKETYLALLDDLGAKNLKIAVHWDLIEPEENKYNFQDLDWQIKEAENHNAKLLLVIGMKTPRWPECHIPEWAAGLSKEQQQQEKILDMLKMVVLRYKDSPALEYWQVENEPFFPFGNCPWVDKKFLKKEVGLVRSLDQKHPVVMSDSGEGSFWIQAARLGDIVGTTMYKKVWVRQLRTYLYYPFRPTFYWRKAQIVKKFFGKKVICVELQAEPWGPVLLYDSPLNEQKKSMNLKQFRYNIQFAKRTGLDRFYLWGGEWWYWMKTKQNQPEIWNEVKKLFEN